MAKWLRASEHTAQPRGFTLLSGDNEDYNNIMKRIIIVVVVVIDEENNDEEKK